MSNKSSWEIKARHGTMAVGLGISATLLGSWLGVWLSFSTPSPFLAHLFAGWSANAWLWLVFAPMAFVVARVFPVKATSFVWVGGISGFVFWFVLNTALFGFERFWAFPLYAFSFLFWFIAGLFWARAFARRGASFFHKAQENAEAVSKSDERYYAQWVAASANMDAGAPPAPASSEQTAKCEPEF